MPSTTGGGPAIAIGPAGNYVYTTSGSNLATWSRNASTGGLTLVGTPFSSGQAASGGGIADALTDVTDLLISSDGAFLYTMSRGDQSIGIYKRNIATGSLQFVEKVARGLADSAGTIVDGLDGGKSLVISPSGDRLYATGDSSADEEDSLAVFRRDATTGRLFSSTP